MNKVALGVTPIIKDEFGFNNDYIFLNHAAVSPWPKRTADVVSKFAHENVTTGPINYLEWVKVEQKLKDQLATLINAPSPEDIALVKNTSEGLSLVAYGIEWSAGDNIVTTNQEFPSNRIVWESLENQRVELRQIDIARQESSPEEALEQACDENTRLLTVSSIQFASGFALDLTRLGKFCKANGILFCIDAIQSLGALQFDVQACHADFVIADGHKWMMAPEGIGLFYCNKNQQDQLKLYEYGWHMVDQPTDYDRKDWVVANNARRFECGSPNMIGIHALSASIGLLLEIGMATVEKMVCAVGLHLEKLLAAIDQLTIVNRKYRKGGIVAFCHHAIPSDRLYKEMTNNNIVCALRSGSIRLSPHFYTQYMQVNEAVRIIESIIMK